MKIHRFAAKGNLDGIKNELANGVAIDALDEEGYTPLMTALASPHVKLDFLRFLVDAGASINCITQKPRDAALESSEIYQDTLREVGESLSEEIKARLGLKPGQPFRLPIIRHCPLQVAVQTGDPEKIQWLLDGGAEVCYDWGGGHTVLVDAFYGHDIVQDRYLYFTMQSLLERGASVRYQKGHSESPLCLASHEGRFDIVRLLLDHGAEFKLLHWTRLMVAVVFGTLEEVKALLDGGADLEAVDGCGRTAWLLSIQAGDIPKAKLILRYQDVRHQTGRCGKTPLMAAIKNRHFDMLEWLIKEGLNLEAMNDYDETALMTAVAADAFDCVRLLLRKGARLNRQNSSGEWTITGACSPEMVRLLVEQGADLQHADVEMRRRILGLPVDYEFQITAQDYFAGKFRQFGTANPSVMNIPFWKEMIRCGVSAYRASAHFADPDPYNGPIWCYDRFGKSITALPDGRFVEIAGEHEDFYDSHFCIYNDVIVFDGQGNFTIYGYPTTIFAPTDFHTATLVGDFIYIIGSLGYQGYRYPGVTPVSRLDCRTFAMEPLKTTGANPGWISGHSAKLEADGIIISGGKVSDEKDDYPDQAQSYRLDLNQLTWTCLD